MPARNLSSLEDEIKALKNEDNMRDPQEAVPRLRDLLRRAKEAGTVPVDDLMDIHLLLSGALFQGMKFEESLAELDTVIAWASDSKSVDATKRMGFRGHRASILSSMARHEEAERELTDVLAYYAVTPGKESLEYAATLYLRAFVQSRQGDYQAASAGMAEALRISRAIPQAPPVRVGTYWQGLVGTLIDLGDFPSAVTQSRQLITYAEASLGEKHLLTLSAMAKLGLALRGTGRYAEAEAIQRREMTVREATEGKGVRLALSMNALATTLRDKGAEADALALFMEAHKMIQANAGSARANKDASSVILRNAGMVAATLGQPGQASHLLQQSVDAALRDVGRDHLAYGQAMDALARQRIGAGNWQAARPMLEEARRVISMRLPVSDPRRMSTEMSLAVTRARLGDGTAYANAVHLFEFARSGLLRDVSDPAWSALRVSGYRDLLALFASLAIEKHDHERSFAALQLAQINPLDLASAALLDRAAPAQSGWPETRRLQDARNEIQRLLASRDGMVGKGDFKQAAQVDDEIVRLQETIDRHLATQTRPVGTAHRWGSIDALTLREVRKKLLPGEGVLLNLASQWGVFSTLVTSSQVVSEVKHVSGRDVRDLVRRVRDSLDVATSDDSRAAFDVDAAWRLHQILMPPTVDGLGRRLARIHVVAAGALNSLPYSILVTEKYPGKSPFGGKLGSVAWLVKRQAVSVPVSMRMLGAPLQVDAVTARHVDFAGIGAPALTGSPGIAMRSATQRLRGATLDAKAVRELPALPETAGELALMKAALGGQGRLITGNEATEETLRTTDLSKYNVLAFATHGLVSGELRGLTEPGLVLTPAANDDGVFTASDVAKLKLNADWVILSACDTAAGETANAPMYSGLARAFVYAGTRSLLLSHWQVRDDIASRLTVETVKASRRGMSRAEALRQAQLRLINDRKVKGGAHPALWAPFVLLGE